MKWTKDQQKDAQDTLRELFRDRRKLYHYPIHVSRSGMLHVVGIVFANDGGARSISRLVSAATDNAYDTDKDGVRIPGTGFSAGSEVIEQLSYKLYGDEKAIDSYRL